MKAYPLVILGLLLPAAAFGQGRLVKPVVPMVARVTVENPSARPVYVELGKTRFSVPPKGSWTVTMAPGRWDFYYHEAGMPVAYLGKVILVAPNQYRVRLYGNIGIPARPITPRSTASTGAL